jgi:hypothetical protein
MALQAARLLRRRVHVRLGVLASVLQLLAGLLLLLLAAEGLQEVRW